MDVSSVIDALKHASQVEEQRRLLAELKIYSRQAAVVKSAFAPDVINTLALLEDHPDALRCLANALLLVESTRQMFVDGGHAVPLAMRLKSCDCDYEFLLCRILMLLTYNTTLDFVQLDKETDLCESIVRLCKRHADQPGQPQALEELFKLFFNITHFFPALTTRLEGSIQPISDLLLTLPIQSPPLQPPMSSTINTMLNLDIGTAAKSIENAAAVVDRLALILDLTVHQYNEKDMDIANPLCTLLRRICEAGMRDQLAAKLLPSDADRKQPLGQGDTLSAHLLRLSVSAQVPELAKNLASLLFELSNSDADQFVRNVGFGYASGHLLSRGMTVEAPTTTSDDTSFNPVTGQSFSSEVNDTTSEMTDEEKEREAERLSVLFERLKATGVIDVKNPVEQLYRDAPP